MTAAEPESELLSINLHFTLIAAPILKDVDKLNRRDIIITDTIFFLPTHKPEQQEVVASNPVLRKLIVWQLSFLNLI